MATFFWRNCFHWWHHQWSQSSEKYWPHFQASTCFKQHLVHQPSIFTMSNDRGYCTLQEELDIRRRAKQAGLSAFLTGASRDQLTALGRAYYDVFAKSDLSINDLRKLRIAMEAVWKAVQLAGLSRVQILILVLICQCEVRLDVNYGVLQIVDCERSRRLLLNGNIVL